MTDYLNIPQTVTQRCKHLMFSAGCATSEDLFWKLEALQNFIRDLHWPDPEFGHHLNQRLKLMACDMLESCIQRLVVM